MGIRHCLQHRVLGLGLVLAAALGLFCARMGVLGLPSIDEQYTIRMINRWPRSIVDFCTVDAHPPGYYFLLKLWHKPFRLAGIEPAILIGRFSGLAWMLFALSVIWFAARRAFGTGAGTAIAWMICLSPRILEAASEMRQYSVVAPFLPAAFLSMMAAWKMDGEPSPPRDRTPVAATWALYGLLAATCLWCHLAAAFMLFAFGVVWIALCASLGRRAFRSSFFVGGALSQLFAIAAFIPWLFCLRGNYDYLMGEQRLWMTPPTGMNLFRTAAGWMPFGSFFHELPSWARTAVLALGAAGCTAPVVAWIVSRFAVRGSGKAGASRAWPGIVALACGAGVAICFWLLARYKIVQLFHGPRYSIIGLGVWIAGLVLLAFAASSRLRRPWVAAAALAPWILVTCAGLVRAVVHEVPSMMADPVQLRRSSLPPDGAPLYIVPGEFIPYLRPAYGTWDLRPFDSIRQQSTGDATVVHFHNWSFFGDPAESDLVYAMEHRRLSEAVDVESDHDAKTIRLHGLRSEVIALLGIRESRDFRRPSVGWALSEAAPEWQNPVDGWYELEHEGDGSAARRAIASPAIARFNRPLGPGRYVLYLRGYQMPYPAPKVTLRFRFPGEPGITAVEIFHGEFELRIPVEFTKRHENPFVAIERPTWAPADWIKGSTDLRPFSFTLRGMWLENPGQ